MRLKHNPIIWFPLVIAASIVLGIIVGNHISTKKFITDKDRKINTVLNLIESEYVDTVDIKELVELTIPKIISNLDPHSYYIPAKDVRATNDDLNGSISGIGITFSMLNDSAHVLEIVPGGPAEKAGILAGDRIITVNDSSIVGPTISSEKVQSMIRGERGTKVKIGIRRNNSHKPLSFEITRGDIPINTVDAAYLLDKGIGYIKVNKFGRYTYDEFLTALGNLRDEGATKYVVDLRGNAGGFMEMATLMANEFLSKGELIVYTKGRDSRENIQVWSDNNGSFHDAQLAVLINEYSASASEIFAGAIQDNDRGLVIGRRSFGKGLVQKQTYLPDSSAIRLTIARYYTPSGRCIQKPYKLGEGDKYSHDLANRYEGGELYHADSIRLDSTHVYKTLRLGRTVYGGGGIMPDRFVPLDTMAYSKYFSRLVAKSVIENYTYNYTDSNRDRIKADYRDAADFVARFTVTDEMLQTILDNAAAAKIEFNEPEYLRCRKLVADVVKAGIGRNIFGYDTYYMVMNPSNPIFKEAYSAINSAESDL